MDFRVVKKEEKILDVEPVKAENNEIDLKENIEKEKEKKAENSKTKKLALLASHFKKPKITNKTFKFKKKEKKEGNKILEEGKKDLAENVKKENNQNVREGFEWKEVKRRGLLYRIFNNFFVKLLLLTLLFSGTAFYAFNLGRTISDTQNWKNKLGESEKKNVELQAKLTTLEAMNIKNENRLKELDKNSAKNAAPASLAYTLGLNGNFAIKDFPSFGINLGDGWSVAVTDETGAIVPATVPADVDLATQPPVIKRNVSFSNAAGSNIVVVLEKEKPVLDGIKCWEEKAVLDIKDGWLRTYEGGAERMYARENKDGSGYGLVIPASSPECKKQRKTFAQGYPYSLLTGGGVVTVKANYKSEADKTLVDNIVKTIKL